MVLAPLWPTLSEENRAWKGFDWHALDRLDAKGYISPTPRAKPSQ